MPASTTTVSSNKAGDLESAVKETSKVLNIRGRVLPSAAEDVVLVAEFTDGTIVEGESQIPRARKPIRKLSLKPVDVAPLPEVLQAIREADLIVVAPATADLLAKMAHGLADDLASTVLLATDKPVLAAPAMNVRMWQHPATQRNLATLKKDGILFVGPDEGEMACGEFGPGRMAEPEAIIAAIEVK